jgi:hypothetical protein
MHELTINCQLGVARHRRGRKELLADAPRQADVPEGRIPRIARLMALAIRFDGLVRSGVIGDYAALARLGCVTRARMTQIMNLRILAPDIQEALLFLPRTVRGRDPIHLRQLQPIAAVQAWTEQRRRWQSLYGRTYGLPGTDKRA